MLLKTVQQRRDINYNRKIISLEVNYDGNLLILCKFCNKAICPLNASSHYMNIDMLSIR